MGFLHCWGAHLINVHGLTRCFGALCVQCLLHLETSCAMSDVPRGEWKSILPVKISNIEQPEAQMSTAAVKCDTLRQASGGRYGAEQATACSSERAFPNGNSKWHANPKSMMNKR